MGEADKGPPPGDGRRMERWMMDDRFVVSLSLGRLTFPGGLDERERKKEQPADV